MNLFETNSGDLRTRVLEYINTVLPTLIIDDEVVLQSMTVIKSGLEQEIGLKHRSSNLILLVTLVPYGINIGETKLNKLNCMYYLPNMKNVNFSGMVMISVNDIHEIIEMWNENIYKIKNINKLMDKI
jgi:hypothetical protein